MAIVLVKHFNADDSCSPFFIVRAGKGQAFDLMFLKPVHGETVTHAGKFPLKFVQHRGGKVGASYKLDVNSEISRLFVAGVRSVSGLPEP